ncbi:MAG: hypothetical protein A2003_04010 [Acinetobacter sp. GWC1_38_13]|nr:MAG: hypothetical protein A2003_04010 [Acinetobacter sp. GWC1_38_13]
MWLKISTLFLMPIIVAQGIVVKQRTPKLLEPIGERQGIVGLGRPLSLLILGDSAAAGVGVEYQHQALSGVLLSQLMNAHNHKSRIVLSVIYSFTVSIILTTSTAV